MSEAQAHGLYLGIDAGGTKTSCAALNHDGVLLGVGSGPAGNFMQLEPPAVLNAISSAYTEALTRAGATAADAVAVCTCLAGFGPDDVPRAKELLDPIFRPAQALYARDLDAALAAVCGAGPGLVVVAGTGSVSYGRNAAGRTHRAGGWGYMVGDEGSAFWLGAQAIRTTLQAFDGRSPRGLLFESVRGRYQVDDAISLERKVYYERWTPAQYAACAPLTTAAAEKGDSAALALVQQAASDLATAARAVISALGLTDERCGIVGSLWNAGAVLRDPFTLALYDAAPQIRVVVPSASPAEGAALLALHSAGVELNPEQIRRPV